MMKRLLIFTFFIAFSLGISAQLPRNFYGATLGVSTKSQAIKALLANKVSIAVNGEDNLNVRNVSFGGVSFDEVIMEFYDNILYKVVFGDNNVMGQAKCMGLVDAYTTKYPTYRYYVDGPGTMFDDDVTEILVTEDYLAFIDMKLNEREKQDNRKLDREIHPYTEPRISTAILGCTLGASTKQQVVNAMKAQNLSTMPYKDSNGAVTAAFSGTSFEGVPFDALITTFYDGKLASISFLRLNYQLSQSEIAALERSLNSKYSAYNKSDKVKDAPQSGPLFDDDRIQIVISPDGVAYGHIELTAKENRRQVRLTRGKR